MTKLDRLAEKLSAEYASLIQSMTNEYDEITIECDVSTIKSFLFQLRDHHDFAFDQLIDLCGVDYLRYGEDNWETNSASEKGFCRGVEAQETRVSKAIKHRFAVVYHLLSTKLNHRLRVRVFLDETHLIIPSAHDIWQGANWFEREAYDLFGILFEGHPDLRRILTDYGFIGHPFRKDFPLSGHVEMRYDAGLQQVIYEPVDIVPRIGVPKVIREDNRYLHSQSEKQDSK